MSFFLIIGDICSSLLKFFFQLLNGTLIHVYSTALLNSRIRLLAAGEQICTPSNSRNEKWRDFCTPFPFRDLLKSDFGDSQAEGLVPVLRDSVLVSVFWNHNFIFNRYR